MSIFLCRSLSRSFFQVNFCEICRRGGAWWYWEQFIILRGWSLLNWQFCTLSKIFASAAYQVLWECENWSDVQPTLETMGCHFKLCQIFVNCVKWLILFFKSSVLWHCWLGGRKGIRHVKLSREVLRSYLSGARCKWFAYGPCDATATPSSLAPVKSRMVYLSGASLPRLSWKRPLNGCSSSSSSSSRSRSRSRSSSRIKRINSSDNTKPIGTRSQEVQLLQWLWFKKACNRLI